MRLFHKAAGPAALLLAAAALGACTAGSFRPQTLAKTDIDLVADRSIAILERQLRELTIKLYRRNPRELQKRRGATLDARLHQLFSQPGELSFGELDNRQSTDAIQLAFDENYTGDRVFAVMAGLTDMLRRSYGYKAEYFVLDELDQQKLYNSARNVEILVWRLSQRRDSEGRLFLLTNEMTETGPSTGLRTGVDNLSFERLFGKMIAVQDLMAEITADSTQRTINRVVQGAASMIFLPI